MKDNTRESLFNLIGGFVEGRCAFDLFAGSGAVGIEALSRGATRAFFIERHIPTAKIIRQNLQSLASDLPATVEAADTFFWTRQFFKNRKNWPTEPWIVFCCPPYALYDARGDELMELLAWFMKESPSGSVVVAEVPENFPANRLPDSAAWRVRAYNPALLCVWRPKSYENIENTRATGQ